MEPISVFLLFSLFHPQNVLHSPHKRKKKRTSLYNNNWIGRKKGNSIHILILYRIKNDAMGVLSLSVSPFIPFICRFDNDRAKEKREDPIRSSLYLLERMTKSWAPVILWGGFSFAHRKQAERTTFPSVVEASPRIHPAAADSHWKGIPLFLSFSFTNGTLMRRQGAVHVYLERRTRRMITDPTRWEREGELFSVYWLADDYIEHSRALRGLPAFAHDLIKGLGFLL